MYWYVKQIWKEIEVDWGGVTKDEHNLFSMRVVEFSWRSAAASSTIYPTHSEVESQAASAADGKPLVQNVESKVSSENPKTALLCEK